MQALKSRIRSHLDKDASHAVEEPKTDIRPDMNGTAMEADAGDAQHQEFNSVENLIINRVDDPNLLTSDDRAIFESQMTQLQEQLVTAMIENQGLLEEEFEDATDQDLYSFKEKHKVDQILRDLEFEKQKSQQLGEELVKARHHSSISEPLDDGLGWVDVAQEALEEENGCPRPRRVLRTRIRDWCVTSFYELLSDFTEDPDPGPEANKEPEQLTVKKLKNNIGRFKSGTKPIYSTIKGLYSTLTWKSPFLTLVVFFVYMYSVWYGWLLPVTLFLLLFRLFINYLRYKGWKINIRYFSDYEEDPSKAETDAFKDLGVSDKFNLVLQVATQVQNSLGNIADNLEKLKNLLTWQQPEATLRLFLVMGLGLILSCLLKGTTLFTIIGLYMGFKMFILEYIYARFPRFKQRHDTTYQIWCALPTDADLERRYHRAAIDRHVLSPSSSRPSSPTHSTAARHDEVSADDQTFCDIFDIPYSERPLKVWDTGRRCTLIDKEKSLTSAFKSGKMFVTRSFLCFERVKFPSPKNILIALQDITGIYKAKPYSWLPGAGMSIEIAVQGLEKPYLFGALLNRDEVYTNLMLHGAALDLPWSGKDGDTQASETSGESAENPSDQDLSVRERNNIARPAAADSSFRMSDLQESEDTIFTDGFTS